MAKSVRISPEKDSGGGQAITFLLAVGSIRQLCRLQTEFRTSTQASSYLHKHRTEFELLARESFERGELEDGVITLTLP